MATRDDAFMTRDVEQQRQAESSRNTVEVKRRALELGFDAVGITTLEPSAYANSLDRWLTAGYAGDMAYLDRQAERRKFPARILPDARVAIVTLTNYFHGSTDPGRKPGESGGAKVAQYAWSTDYHTVLGRRLERLAGAVREIVPDATTRCYVDAGRSPSGSSRNERDSAGSARTRCSFTPRSARLRSSVSSSPTLYSTPTSPSRRIAAAAAEPVSTRAPPPRS